MRSTAISSRGSAATAVIRTRLPAAIAIRAIAARSHSRPVDMRKTSIALLLTTLAASAAHAQIAVKNQGYIPYSDAPIFYRSEDIDDPVTRLQHQIDAGKKQLVHDGGEHGYLKSVLELLEIPVSSQTLVFSKTSFQY